MLNRHDPFRKTTVRNRGRRLPSLFFFGFLSILTGLTGVAEAAEWSGLAAVEGRLFWQDSQDWEDGQSNFHPSVALQPEFHHRWGNQTVAFVPFARWDGEDDQRTHLDIRELSWMMAGEEAALRIGIQRIFWGVTEGVHRVDILNQTDLVEEMDGEEKLGQPMLNLALIRRWGTLDLFLLTGARERTFPGAAGRLRTALPVATDQAEFDKGRDHMDGAVRWARTMGVWDLGLSHFWGTAREPQLQLRLDANDRPRLIPVYDLIQQGGLEVQATLDRWLWKLEAIRRTGRPATENAAAGGLEYTRSNFYAGMEMGLILEYLWDDREAVPFDDDLALGCRLVWNDAQSSEMFLSVVIDRNTQARLISIEGSRRIGERWKMMLQGRLFDEIPPSDPLFGFRNDDFLQMTWVRYF
jgi:hypothetical protein